MRASWLAVVAICAVQRFWLLSFPATAGGAEPKMPSFFAYLTGSPKPAMVAYSPSELDPRVDANHARLPTSSIRADLQALRPVFDGLVLYGYHEQSTWRIVQVAKQQKFRAVLLGIWNPRSAAEIDGVATLVNQFQGELALGVVIGNEGIMFHRYEPDDLVFAAERLRSKIPKTVPLTTSEPLGGYKDAFVREFGDFLAPNIHPVFDRPNLPAGEAAAWVRQQAAHLARQSKKPVLVKETGFPHGGKPDYTPQTQSVFWEAYLKPGILAWLDDSPTLWVFYGVAFEAFDLPWKAEASHLPIEGCWGMLSHDRRPYPALQRWQNGSEFRRKGGVSEKEGVLK